MIKVTTYITTTNSPSIYRNPNGEFSVKQIKQEDFTKIKTQAISCISQQNLADIIGVKPISQKICIEDDDTVIMVVFDGAGKIPNECHILPSTHTLNYYHIKRIGE